MRAMELRLAPRDVDVERAAHGLFHALSRGDSAAASAMTTAAFCWFGVVGAPAEPSHHAFTVENVRTLAPEIVDVIPLSALERACGSLEAGDAIVLLDLASNAGTCTVGAIVSSTKGRRVRAVFDPMELASTLRQLALFGRAIRQRAAESV